MTRVLDKIVPSDTRLPPAPPGVHYVALPVIRRIVVADDELRRRINRRFHWPMIVLALAILPLLVIELTAQPEGGLRRAVQIGFGVIWLAFVVEFVLKIAIAECRIEYVRRNWLDVIIILVPVLRPLRLGGAATRTTRVFKLRGVAMKFGRSLFTVIIGMEATDRMLSRVGLKRGEGLRRPETMTRHQLMTEVRQRRRAVAAWEAWYAAHEAYVEAHGGPGSAAPPPDRALEEGNAGSGAEATTGAGAATPAIPEG